MRSNLERRVLRWFGRDTDQPQATGDVAGATREHQVLAKAWGIEACDVCGRTILLGETVSWFSRGERLVKACPVCEESMISGGYSRAA